VKPSALLHYAPQPALAAVSPYDMLAYLAHQLVSVPPTLAAHKYARQQFMSMATTSALASAIDVVADDDDDDDDEYPSDRSGVPAAGFEQVNVGAGELFVEEEEVSDGEEHNDGQESDDGEEGSLQFEESPRSSGAGVSKFISSSPHRMPSRISTSSIIPMRGVGPRYTAEHPFSSSKPRHKTTIKRYYQKRTVLFSSGDGSNFTLGHGDVASKQTPSRVRALEQHHIVSVSCSQYVSAAITDDGSLWTWGFGSGGRLGTISTTSELTPRRLMPSITTATNTNEASANSVKFTSVSVASFHGAALAKDGTLWTWGRCKEGQLGHGPLSELGNLADSFSVLSSSPSPSHMSSSPISQHFTAAGGAAATSPSGSHDGVGTAFMPLCRVKALRGTTIVQVACGEYHTVALDDEGNVWVMGANQHGQLGIGPPPLRDEWYPRQLTSLGNVFATKVCCGSRNTVLATKTHDIYLFGNGNVVPRRVCFSFGYPSVLSMKSSRAGNVAAQRFTLKQIATPLVSSHATADPVLMLTDQNELYEYVEGVDVHPRRLQLVTSSATQTTTAASPSSSNNMSRTNNSRAERSGSISRDSEAMCQDAMEDGYTLPPVSCWQPFVPGIFLFLVVSSRRRYWYSCLSNVS
jgi:alpha-tubulin suppressor-like RCC1 family protein